MASLDASKSSGNLPQYVRLPRSGEAEPYTGLHRTLLDRLVRPQACNDYKPPVNSHIVRVKGNERGIRLIHLASLLAYINGLPGAQPNQIKPQSKSMPARKKKEAALK